MKTKFKIGDRVEAGVRDAPTYGKTWEAGNIVEVDDVFDTIGVELDRSGCNVYRGSDDVRLINERCVSHSLGPVIDSLVSL